MTITQTVEIPADRRITVPGEVPTGHVILTFAPVKKPRMTEAEEIELINRHVEELNSEALDALSYQKFMNPLGICQATFAACHQTCVPCSCQFWRNLPTRSPQSQGKSLQSTQDPAGRLPD